MIDEHFDNHYKGRIKDLETKLMRQTLKTDKRESTIKQMVDDHAKSKTEDKIRIKESKQCIDNLSAELGKIKRKLKREQK